MANETKTAKAKEFTAEDAKKIYALLINERIDAGTISNRYGYEIKNVEQVLAEMNRLDALAIKTVKGNKDISKPALVAKLSSKLLDAERVVDDVVKHNPSINDARTFADFKTEIKNLLEEE